MDVEPGSQWGAGSVWGLLSLGFGRHGGSVKGVGAGRRVLGWTPVQLRGCGGKSSQGWTQTAPGDERASGEVRPPVTRGWRDADGDLGADRRAGRAGAVRRGRLCWTTGLGAAHLLPLCTQQLGRVSASRPRTPRLRTLALVAGSGCGGLHGARTGSVGESGRSLAVRGVSMAAVSVTRGSATQEQ